MTDLVWGTFLLIAFAAQVVAAVITFGGGSPHTEQLPADRSGDR